MGSACCTCFGTLVLFHKLVALKEITTTPAHMNCTGRNIEELRFTLLQMMSPSLNKVNAVNSLNWTATYTPTKPKKVQKCVSRERTAKVKRRQYTYSELIEYLQQRQSMGQTYTKPHLAYSQLICAAILQSPKNAMMIQQIYCWISSNFPYFKMNEQGWQNSVRHNLSSNPHFAKTVKIDSNTDGTCKRKCFLWTVVPGREDQFYTRESNSIREQFKSINQHLIADKENVDPTASHFPTSSSNTSSSSSTPSSCFSVQTVQTMKDSFDQSQDKTVNIIDDIDSKLDLLRTPKFENGFTDLQLQQNNLNTEEWFHMDQLLDSCTDVFI
ncbi:forkhead box transcription factor KNAG_0D00450 [Huiozyma naganishii CBS 8797]|uniref:Fork-head domain-containing protein n=1 Tax=Huiozyma naganishii (strain ATCC MYA-139 / BCRC 22969 / CBS 8797 / KCTC 17520 / NBRC 10181 / NCYC 3082 / Yp74L-3) TaxID=1071383 RepID=J7RJW3_HUIN7|nr:hypothetical protein KNAG_0D00450 [Kazachstania naganishii CBS 8797]CCK69798.1 hypothetical protein KNAG_0D00450 [Kazachstania naganishii CBS 8797]